MGHVTHPTAAQLQLTKCWQNFQQVEPKGALFVHDFLGANGRALCAAILRACGVSPLRAPRARLLLCAL
jgi:hypothetical protein